MKKCITSISCSIALVFISSLNALSSEEVTLLNASFEEHEDFARGNWAAKISGDGWVVVVPSEKPEPYAGKGCLLIEGKGIGEADIWQAVGGISEEAAQPSGQEYILIANVFPGIDCSDDVVIKVGFESKVVVDGEHRQGSYYLAEARVGDLKKGEWNPLQAKAGVGDQTLHKLFVKLWVSSKEEDAVVDVALDELELSPQ